MNRVRPPPMEKNQNETGVTLSFSPSDAIHGTRNRIEKKAWPRNPTVSQKCSDVIMLVFLVAAVARWLRRLDGRADGRESSHSHYRTRPRVAPPPRGGRGFGGRPDSGGSVGPDVIAMTRAPAGLLTVWTQPGGRRA